VPGADPHPAALAGLHWFGIVQYIGAGRTADWIHFYTELFGCRLLEADARFGVLPRGRVLQTPDGALHLQLVEPEPGTDDGGDERLHRVAFGTPDVLAAVQALRERGVEFVQTPQLPVSERGALARSPLDGVMFELVRHGI
jgi:4-hydroxyphenylpyruvate dioxygenase